MSTKAIVVVIVLVVNAIGAMFTFLHIQDSPFWLQNLVILWGVGSALLGFWISGRAGLFDQMRICRED